MTATPYAPVARPFPATAPAASSAGRPARGRSGGVSRETVVALAMLPVLAGGGFVLGGALFSGDPATGTAATTSAAHTVDAAPAAPAAPAPAAPAAPAPSPAPAAAAPAPAAAPAAPVPAAGAALARGASGEDVRRWQARMAERGWSITVDGVFGAESAAVARRFQAEKGLAVDGVVGPRTWAAAWELPITSS